VSGSHTRTVPSLPAEADSARPPDPMPTATAVTRPGCPVSGCPTGVARVGIPKHTNHRDAAIGPEPSILRRCRKDPCRIIAKEPPVAFHLDSGNCTGDLTILGEVN